MNWISESWASLLGIKKPVFSASIEWARWWVVNALGWDFFLSVSDFKKQGNWRIERLDKLVQSALYQAEKNPIWNNIKLVLLISKPPSEIDNIVPWDKEISRLYKDSLDATIIPKAFWSNGTVVYMIPASIGIAENWWDEIAKLSLQE